MSDVLIVAELTANHLGNVDRAMAMIERALDDGADYVKLQRRNPTTFYTESKLQTPFDTPFGRTFGEYREGLELSDSDFDLIDRNFRGKWFASALDLPSYEFLKTYDTPLMKLPSTISRNWEYIDHVTSDWHRGLVISLGMTDLEYFHGVRFLVEDHVNRIRSNGNNEDVSYILQCTSAYPAPPEELNLGVISMMDWDNVDYLAGYSSHDQGSLGSMLAVAAGAMMIEKHVTLPGAEWVERNEVAVDLERGDFKDFVGDIRLAEEMVGASTPQVTSSEDHKY